MSASTSTDPNPFVELYRKWADLLQWLNGGPVFLGKLARSPKALLVGGGGEGAPLALGPSGEIIVWPDGSFEIRYYDTDLLWTLPHVPLRTEYVSGRRVLLYDHRTPFNPHTAVEAEMVPYFEWRSLRGEYPQRRRLETPKLTLVPDPHVEWRIAIHPESGGRAYFERILDHQYDMAAARYLRAVRRWEREHGRTSEPEEVIARHKREVRAITMALDPYKPAKRPQEAHA